MKPYKLIPKIGLALAAALLLGSLESVQAQSNLVINGTFDTDASGWTKSSPTGGGWNAKGDPGGCFFILTYPQSEVQTVSQTIHGLIPGDSYLLSGTFMYSDDYRLNIEAPSFGVTMGGVTVFESRRWDDISHHAFNVPFTAASSSEDLSFSAQLNNTQVSYLIDNIAIQAIPEPSSLYLLAMGGIAGLFFLRNRACKARS